MEFFTSPEDLMGWVKIQESPDAAARRLLEITEFEDEQDITETCRAIFEGEDEVNSSTASEALFGVLAKHNLVMRKEADMKNRMKKEAQMMRQDSVYGQMPLRVCPKLPYSVGKRLISTYNCRHYCLDSLVLDDDPTRVYCAEALWRRHVMDKFSREFKNDKGEWVGGYLNQRFVTYTNTGGNPMELANAERTRKPRPHQYSIERRLEEGRGEKTESITASSNKMVKLASNERPTGLDGSDEAVFQMFSDIIEMREAGLSEQDILTKVSEHYDVSIPDVAILQKIASRQMQRHANTVYSMRPITKTANVMSPFPEKSTLESKMKVPVELPSGERSTLEPGSVVVLETASEKPLFQVTTGPNTGSRFYLSSGLNMANVFNLLDSPAEQGNIQEAAQEIGLNDTSKAVEPTIEEEVAEGDFPVEVVEQNS